MLPGESKLIRIRNSAWQYGAGGLEKKDLCMFLRPSISYLSACSASAISQTQPTTVPGCSRYFGRSRYISWLGMITILKMGTAALHDCCSTGACSGMGIG
jgi:hypothetical protein